MKGRLRLDLIGGSRKTNVTVDNPLVHGSNLSAAVSVTYRPRFTFSKGL